MPAANVSALPKIFRWVFTVLTGFAVLCAFVLCVAMVVRPQLPAGTHFGPENVELLGQPGTVALRAVNGDSDFTVTALRGSVILFVEKAGGLIQTLERYGFPVALIHALFFAALFDLLRRLFRNVGHGESFTRQSVVLVQLIGGALIVYSLVSAIAEHWFVFGIYSYLAQHAVVTISGTQLHLPAAHGFSGGHGFGSPVFFSGLLVLALSEVFRQGVALKSENDLTV